MKYYSSKKKSNTLREYVLDPNFYDLLINKISIRKLRKIRPNTSLNNKHIRKGKRQRPTTSITNLNFKQSQKYRPTTSREYRHDNQKKKLYAKYKGYKKFYSKRKNIKSNCCSTI